MRRERETGQIFYAGARGEAGAKALCGKNSRRVQTSGSILRQTAGKDVKIEILFWASDVRFR
jgi:hypothetical protein